MNTHSAAQIASLGDAAEERRQGNSKDQRGSPCKSASSSPQSMRPLALSQSHPNVINAKDVDANKMRLAGDSLLSQLSANMQVPTACTNAINELDTSKEPISGLSTLDTTRASLQISQNGSSFLHAAEKCDAHVSNQNQDGSLNVIGDSVD